MELKTPALLMPELPEGSGAQVLTSGDNERELLPGVQEIVKACFPIFEDDPDISTFLENQENLGESPTEKLPPSTSRGKRETNVRAKQHG